MQPSAYFPVSISQVDSEAEILTVRDLMREYIVWAFTLEAGSEAAPTFEGIEEELAGLPGSYSPPLGRLLVARHGGTVAGFVCLRPIDGETSEVKRLYVSPAKRGLNIGQLLINKLVEEAQAAGYRRIVLDSHISMAKAHTVYEAAGFRRVAPAESVPDWVKDVAIFMEWGS
jgi:putative acetyltransferase